uniref:Uncharacterized protein n=1 Tax=Anguilla anguilla TaxID=7936 RepID=A0A0E9UU41_ANGAN
MCNLRFLCVHTHLIRVLTNLNHITFICHINRKTKNKTE